MDRIVFDKQFSKSDHDRDDQRSDCEESIDNRMNIRLQLWLQGNTTQCNNFENAMQHSNLLGDHKKSKLKDELLHAYDLRSENVKFISLNDVLSVIGCESPHHLVDKIIYEFDSYNQGSNNLASLSHSFLSI